MCFLGLFAKLKIKIICLKYNTILPLIIKVQYKITDEIKVLRGFLYFIQMKKCCRFNLQKFYVHSKVQIRGVPYGTTFS